MGRPANLPELIIKKVKPHAGLYAKNKMKTASKTILYQSIADVLNSEEKLVGQDKLEGNDIIRIWENIRKGYAAGPCSYYLKSHLGFLDSHIKSKRFSELKEEGLSQKKKTGVGEEELASHKNLDNESRVLPDPDIQSHTPVKSPTPCTSSNEPPKQFHEEIQRPNSRTCSQLKNTKNADKKREAEVCSVLNNAVQKLNELVNEEDTAMSVDDYMQGLRQGLINVAEEDLLFCVADLSMIMNGFIHDES